MVSKELANAARKQFGVNAEMFLATLFEAEMIADNSNLPDLKIPETNILIECKSSKKPKVDIVIDQMEYYLRGDKEFQELCRQYETQSNLDLFPENENSSIYYSIIKRDDDFSEADLIQDLSAIGLNWREQFIIPAQLVWTIFHLEYSRKIRIGENQEYRKRVRVSNILDERKKLINIIASRKVSKDKGLYTLRDDLSSQSWQNITHNTLLSLFHNSNYGNSDISKWLKNRIPKYYEEFNELKRIETLSPCGLPIKMLIKPEDIHDFENIQDRIRRNSPLIERIRSKRRLFLENEISKISVKLKSGRILDPEIAKKYYHHCARPQGFSSSSELDELLQQDLEYPESRIFRAINPQTGEIGPIYRSYPRNLFDSDPNGIKRDHPGLEHVVAACQWREF